MSFQWDRQIVSLVIIAIISNASFSSVAPVLPLEIDNHRIPEQWISLIFIAYPIGHSVASPIVARQLEIKGTPKVMAVGMVIQSVLYYWLGIVFEVVGRISETDDLHDKQDSDNLLICMLTITQFFLGASMAMIVTAYYSTATLNFPSEKEFAIACVESSVGAGYVVGPIIGSIIYDEMGYRTCFFAVSFGMMSLAVVTWKFLAASLGVCGNSSNENGCEDISNDDNVVSKETWDFENYNSINGHGETAQSHLSIVQRQSNLAANATTIGLLKFPKLIIAVMSIMWANVAWTFLEPILAKHLEDENIGKKMIGIVFSISNVTYCLSSFLMQYVHKHWRRHTAISISLLLTPISVVLVGSSSFTLVLLGMALLGIFPMPVWIMLLPYVQEYALTVYPNSMERRVNDLTTGLYNSFLTLGQVLGYVIGPLVNGSYGFTVTTRIVSSLIFLQSLLFYYHC